MATSISNEDVASAATAWRATQLPYLKTECDRHEIELAKQLEISVSIMMETAIINNVLKSKLPGKRLPPARKRSRN